ncbi:hypothetical protein CDCA_CDCA11G3178 [Cyanidium caldarium]|uniref:Eukaryotic translation initiation factor 3 30 kDa subunit n=1 Tax=Cyanidium caldarium TaxID=2771 RepID=A0AAV9IZC4_CYACA|nr:hypothetical protein CDCA_CDCA11G3178 [Cyanidium caldarium]
MASWDDDDDDDYQAPDMPHRVSEERVVDSWDADDAEFDVLGGGTVDRRKAAAAATDAEGTARPELGVSAVSERDAELSAKIRERQLREREQQERERALQQQLESMSVAERKVRLQQLEEEHALRHAEELFGPAMAATAGAESTASATAGGVAAAAAGNSASLDTMVPRTKADFDRYAKRFAERLGAFRKNAKTPRTFILFLKELLRQICVESGSVQAIEVAELAKYLSDTLRPERERRDANATTAATAGGVGAHAGSAAAGALGTGAAGSAGYGAKVANKKGTLRVERADDFSDFAGSARGAAGGGGGGYADDDDDFM